MGKHSNIKSKSKHDFDVLINGGGPAGCAAALTLLNQTDFKVGVIEATDYTNMRIGESVSASIVPLLKYLKVKNEFLSSNHIPSYGINTSWGSSTIFSRDFFFTPHGLGWNLDRNKFDRMLADSVKKRKEKSVLFSSTKIIDCIIDKKNKISLNVCDNKNNSKTKISANFVIDASGKSGSFGHKVGAKWKTIDYLIGAACLYESLKKNNQDEFTLIEAISNGWWYSTPISTNKRVVVFMTDNDIARHLEIKKIKNWNIALKKTLHIKKTIKDARLVIGVNLFPAYSQVIQKCGRYCSNWIPAGDSAASYDPLSSIGIGHAISSGINAARVAYTVLKKDNTNAISQYLNSITQNFSQYLSNRIYYYSLEKRWKDKPFWNKRCHIQD